jgi:hypothetical protein
MTKRLIMAEPRARSSRLPRNERPASSNQTLCEVFSRYGFLFQVQALWPKSEVAEEVAPCRSRLGTVSPHSPPSTTSKHGRGRFRLKPGQGGFAALPGFWATHTRRPRASAWVGGGKRCK